MKRKTKGIDFKELRCMLNNKISRKWKVDELLDITQGHDFIGIFQCYYKRNSVKEPIEII